MNSKRHKSKHPLPFSKPELCFLFGVWLDTAEDWRRAVLSKSKRVFFSRSSSWQEEELNLGNLKVVLVIYNKNTRGTLLFRQSYLTEAYIKSLHPSSPKTVSSRKILQNFLDPQLFSSHHTQGKEEKEEEEERKRGGFGKLEMRETSRERRR